MSSSQSPLTRRSPFDPVFFRKIVQNEILYWHISNVEICKWFLAIIVLGLSAALVPQVSGGILRSVVIYTLTTSVFQLLCPLFYLTYGRVYIMDAHPPLWLLFVLSVSAATWAAAGASTYGVLYGNPVGFALRETRKAAAISEGARVARKIWGLSVFVGGASIVVFATCLVQLYLYVRMWRNMSKVLYVERGREGEDWIEMS